MKEYKKPSVTSDIIIFTEKNNERYVLLIRRKNPPYQGMYGFPGGFLEENETIWDCARRELKEETNVDVSKLYELGLFSDPGRDERGWVISDAFTTLIDYDKLNINAGDDASEAKLFKVSYEIKDNKMYITLTNNDIILENIISNDGEIIKSNMCFDHLKMLQRALRTLSL